MSKNTKSAIKSAYCVIGIAIGGLTATAFAAEPAKSDWQVEVGAGLGQDNNVPGSVVDLTDRNGNVVNDRSGLYRALEADIDYRYRFPAQQKKRTLAMECRAID